MISGKTLCGKGHNLRFCGHGETVSIVSGVHDLLVRVLAHWPTCSQDCLHWQYLGPWQINPRNTGILVFVDLTLLALEY